MINQFAPTFFSVHLPQAGTLPDGRFFASCQCSNIHPRAATGTANLAFVIAAIMEHDKLVTTRGEKIEYQP